MKKKDYINKDNLKRLKEELGEERFKHSLRVMESASKLADHYGIDRDKAEVAALFHDCAKYADKSISADMVKKYKLEDNEELKNSVQLIHSFLGPHIAKDVYGIEDVEVLDAIKYHTTLRKKPTDMDKLVYLADLIEVGRDFEGVEELREMAYEDMDATILKSLENTIFDLIRKKRYIGTDTLEARNFFLMENLRKQ